MFTQFLEMFEISQTVIIMEQRRDRCSELLLSKRLLSLLFSQQNKDLNFFKVTKWPVREV
jgi:hypothetical protein